MRRIAAILLLALLLQPPPPLTARWDRPGVATVAWGSTGRACLYKTGVEGSVFLGCWDGPQQRTFGGSSNTDGRYRPYAGDVYQLTVDGVSSFAPLRSVVYLAVWRA